MASSFTLPNSPHTCNIAFSSSRHQTTASVPLSGGGRHLHSLSPSSFKCLRIQMPFSLVNSSPTTASFSSLPRLVCNCKAQETVIDLPTVTDATWQSLVLKAEVPVLVEFWAPWCGPCRIIHPIVAELSEQYAGKLNFLKLNTDESPSTASKYGIRSVPTIMIFVNGEKKDAVLGSVPKTTLTTAIEKFL